MSNEDLESSLQALPEEVASALMEWRTCTLERERLEAALYIKEKLENPDKTVKEIQAMLKADDKIYQAKLKEIAAEGNYQFLLERLLTIKKRASLRTAY